MLEALEQQILIQSDILKIIFKNITIDNYKTFSKIILYQAPLNLSILLDSIYLLMTICTSNYDNLSNEMMHNSN